MCRLRHQYLGFGVRLRSCCWAGWHAGRGRRVRILAVGSWGGGRRGIGSGWSLSGGGEVFVLGWKKGRVCRAERCGRGCGRASARSRRGRYEVFAEVGGIIGAVELRRRHAEDTSFKVFIGMNWVRDENACSPSLLLFLFRCHATVRSFSVVSRSRSDDRSIIIFHPHITTSRPNTSGRISIRNSLLRAQASSLRSLGGSASF